MSLALRPAKRQRMILFQSTGKSKFNGCTNWLEWLASMDPDALTEVWLRVFQRTVAPRVHRPLRFENLLHAATHFWTDTRKERIEVSVWYVRWLSMKHYRIEPGSHVMEWRIPRIAPVWFTYHGLSSDSRKHEVLAVAQECGIHARYSWTKAKIWRHILQAAPVAKVRFKSYLVHKIENGRVVAERSVN